MQEETNDLQAQWWACTSAGNEALEEADFATAWHNYEAALSISDRLFDLALADTTASLVAPMTFNSAAHNLAALSRQKGDTDAASRYLVTACEKLLTNAESWGIPAALRVNCSRHLPRAVAYLEQLCPDNSDRPDIRALMARASAVRTQLSRSLCSGSSLPRDGTSGQTIH